MISEFVEYVKQVWKNKPNVSSPLNADRMNHMEAGIENNSKKIKETVTAVNELTEKTSKTIDVTSGMKITKSEITFSDTCNVQIKNGIAFVCFSLKTLEAGKTINVNTVYGNTGAIVTGLPKPKNTVLTYGDKFGFNASKPETMRYKITTNGELINHYNNANVVFDNNPTSFYVAYPTDD